MTFGLAVKDSSKPTIYMSRVALGALLPVCYWKLVAINPWLSWGICLDEYEDGFATFLELSGVPITIENSDDDSFRPFWEAVARLLKAGTGQEFDAGSVNDSWMEPLINYVTGSVLNCWTFGGRVWEITIASFRIASFGSVCAPRACDRQNMEEDVAPKYIRHMLKQSNKSLPNLYSKGQHNQTLQFGELNTSEIVAEEVSIWSRLNLDFAIVGLPHCGTTSLHMNLARHPEIAFSTFRQEDGFFVPGGAPNYIYWGRNKIIPLVDQTEIFNSKFLKRGSGRRVTRGVSSPRIHESALAIQALRHITGLRIIGILCDPLSRLEKYLWQWHISLQDAVNKPWLWASIRVAERLRRLQYYFGHNIAWVHQEMLRNKEKHTYNALVKWLGVGTAFNAEYKFRRFNSNVGPRTGLCQNATLVKSLKRLLKSEYMAMEELLSAHHVDRSILDKIRRQGTRCDRPEELAPNAFAGCTNKTMCKLSTQARNTVIL